MVWFLLKDRTFLLQKVLWYDSTSIAFSSYGDYWRQLRKICTMNLLSTKRVEQLRSIREEEALNLVRRISTNGDSLPFNLSKAIFNLTSTVTSRAAFGNKNKDQEEFEVVLDQVLKALGGFNIGDMYPKAKLLHKITGARASMNKIQKRVDRILQNILVDHRNRKQESLTDDYEDLVDVLLRIQNEDQLQFPVTDNCIKAVILDVFGGGSETSSAATEWAMSEMVKNPHIMKRAQAEVRKVFDEKRNVDETGLGELKYLQCVIKETLRLHPPLPLLVPRENSAECEVNGFLIPANCKVIINAWAISRDPKYWVDAEIFKPERFMDNSIDYQGTNFGYIPFGAGRRICPGMSFGMANIELPLAQLLFHFNWKLPNESNQEEIDMTEEFGISVRRKNHLNLIPVLYHRSDFIV
uniref:Cytochrome P450 VoCYP71BE87 n=1 Tax=Valeriana officinalis TaxID=19953 RepID=A0A2R4NA38_VALOF|nr:cytochrome P450 VoCYP71BE87 [Valeriana officinalis]